MCLAAFWPSLSFSPDKVAHDARSSHDLGQEQPGLSISEGKTVGVKEFWGL